MHFPAAADKEWSQAMHDSRQHTRRAVSTIQRDFNLAPDHLNGKRIQQNPGEERQREHQGKWQRHCTVENNHRHNVNVRVIEPRQRRDKKFGDLRDQNQDQQTAKKNHLRPSPRTRPPDEKDRQRA